jgi:hypothetical protein
MTDEFCQLLRLCGDFTREVIESIFRQLDEQQISMNQFIESLPANERRLIAFAWLGYTEGNCLVGARPDEAEKLI